MSNEIVVRFCAPTLAGMKVGSLFNTKFTSLSELFSELISFNTRLNTKGVYIEVLRLSTDRALIFVYRKNVLNKILGTFEIREFLKKYGYAGFDIKSSLNLLREHLKNSEFPHEIGIFLGYPLEDVIGFIENKGQNHKYVGQWKVYSNVEKAKELFSKYKKCTSVYLDKISQGFDIAKLAV